MYSILLYIYIYIYNYYTIDYIILYSLLFYSHISNLPEAISFQSLCSHLRFIMKPCSSQPRHRGKSRSLWQLLCQGMVYPMAYHQLSSISPIEMAVFAAVGPILGSSHIDHINYINFHSDGQRENGCVSLTPMHLVALPKAFSSLDLFLPLYNSQLAGATRLLRCHATPNNLKPVKTFWFGTRLSHSILPADVPVSVSWGSDSISPLGALAKRNLAQSEVLQGSLGVCCQPWFDVKHFMN